MTDDWAQSVMDKAFDVLGQKLAERQVASAAAEGSTPEVDLTSWEPINTAAEREYLRKALEDAAQREAAQKEVEIRSGEKLAQRFTRVVTRMRPAPGDVLVLHVPNGMSEREFNRISSVMNVLISKFPEVCYLMLPDIVRFGQTIRTEMSRAEVVEQLRSLLGVLNEEPVGKEPVDKEEV